jgi:adenylate cyclase
VTDTTLSHTRTDLQKLDELISDLGVVVDRQHQTIVGTHSHAMLQSSAEIARLLAPLKLTLQGLVRRVEAQEKERQQLRALQEVGAVINSSLDQAEVLNIVIDTIIGLTGAERTFLMLVDEETGELEVEVARNINRETIRQSSFEISRSIVQAVFESGSPVVTTNAQADPRFARQESVVSYNLRSILCVPLKIREIIIGVIYADNRVVSGIFVDADRDLLAAFANQAAVAIENARLFRQIREQLAHITEMTNLMNDVFDSIASGVITLNQSDLISLYNRAAERILGVPGHLVLDQHYRDVLEPIGETMEKLVQTVKANGGHESLEVDAVLRKRQGTATLNLTLSPLRDVQQEMRGVAVVVDDVSEKKRLESVRRYLPPALVDRVRDLDAVQRPQRQTVTILFADIRGFSTFSEKLEPERLIEIINQYFTVAAHCISEYEGMIDKFMGDAVMALFNTPLNPQDDHTARAVRTALSLRRKLDAFHAGLPDDQRLHMGVGIHVGEAVVGNVGSQFRKDYSALGDAVNLAKRLQEIARPGQILISQDTYRQVQEWAEAMPLEPIQVKGRQALEQIYELQSSTVSS